MMKQVNIQIPLRTLALLLGLFLSVGAFAQINVKGHVKDAQGEPIIGATVRVEGTQTGTVTDYDGNFSLKANQGATLTVSFVGFQTTTVKVAPSVVVTLQDDAQLLKDVVVIGYGTVKKSDATGSVQSIEADQLGKGFATSPADLLQGKSAGVTITSNSGAPGAGSKIRIRGGSSLSASNDPLIVIDGLPISSTGISGSADVLSTINPNDIESFSILKDASATAIYGSRASNGVIVITTKKGASGKPKVTLDMNATVQTIAKKVDVLSAQGLYDFFSANYGDNADAMAALGATVDENGKVISPTTDWQDEIYRTSMSYEVNASVTGGYQNGDKTFKMPYRVSAGWLDNNGILKTSSMNRGTVGINLTPTLLNERLTINLNGKGVFTSNDFVDEKGIIGAAVKYIPTKSVYKEDGSFTRWENGNGSVNTMSILNPVAQLEEQDKTSYVRRFVGNAQFDYKFQYVPGLRANLNLGLDISTSNGYEENKYQSEFSYHDKTENGAGLWKRYTQLRRDQTLEFYLDYAKDIEAIKSRIDIMGGYSWQHFFNSTTESKESNEPEGAHTKYAVSKPIFKTENYLVSFFGRLNYTLMDRYLLTATIRRDGTSRFQNNKWGTFPSVALAWRISEEDFLKNVNALSNLKLRLGWGITGQQNIDDERISKDYPSISTYHTNQAGSLYMFGNSVVTPISPMGYAAQLKWEETTTYNVGLDFGFLKNRINGSVDVYKRKTADLLNIIPVTTGTNLTDMLLMNVGDLENTGFEVALNVVPVQTKDWRWEVGLNFAYNKNEITKLTAYDDPSYIGVRTGAIAGGVDNKIQLHSIGHPISSFWVYQQVYDQNGKPLDGVFVDRNADGQIDDYDRYIYTKPDPDVTFGFNTELNYKNWTLSASARANFNNYVYNNVASDGEMIADLWTNNFISNRVASAPYSNFSTARYLSDYYVRNASFFKLDRVTLAYNITDWARVHFTAQNVFTITDYDGLDPEVGNGIDNNMYPRPRTFLVGASFNF